MQEAKPDRRLEVDEAARRLARGLVRTARFASLAALSPATGAPIVSRVSVASDASGHPLILVSDLSSHTAALRADRRCSLLLGEPGEGDPLAHPRISIAGEAEFLARGSDERTALRARFLARHPEAEVYADFGDFHVVRIHVRSAGLNGGFAKAYTMQAGDVVEPALPSADLAAGLERARRHMNEDHADAVETLAKRAGGAPGGWTIATADSRGFELASGDALLRIEFPSRIETPVELRQAYVSLLVPGEVSHGQ